MSDLPEDEQQRLEMSCYYGWPLRLPNLCLNQYLFFFYREHWPSFLLWNLAFLLHAVQFWRQDYSKWRAFTHVALISAAKAAHIHDGRSHLTTSNIWCNSNSHLFTHHTLVRRLSLWILKVEDEYSHICKNQQHWHELRHWHRCWHTREHTHTWTYAHVNIHTREHTHTHTYTLAVTHMQPVASFTPRCFYCF